jgi:hypothetical protein
VLVGRDAGARRPADARVVDERVQAAEALDRLGHRARHAAGVGDVARDDVRVVLDRRKVQPRHLPAAAAQLGPQRGAEGAAGAGDQCSSHAAARLRPRSSSRRRSYM